MVDTVNPIQLEPSVCHQRSLIGQGFSCGALPAALTGVPVNGRRRKMLRRFTMASPIVLTTLAALISPAIAQSLDPLKAPQGTYVASKRTCADLDQGVGALELAEFDGDAISVGANTCKIAGSKHSGDTFQASCAERGSSPVVTPIKITRPSSNALSINGTIYNFCPGK
ncbi:hypothetical protein QA648_35400 (plasmid) [Rhizobium sp. CB3171]|uniref:hypothetical protein n=1 Tax=Rhizobium sp. CB3171 TaxID=3039157 RepID=UPI0024B12AE8|nr:hypothetical protein [Rhizobium sp. CB3171]WFU07191.1 hypothetical protein QA648_35400 [Rhizobium sp. CB3171]